MANTLRFEVPFPVAGEGIVLRYTMKDLGTLRGKYGDAIMKMPELDADGRPIHVWRQNVFNRLDQLDPVVISDCIAAGAKQTGTNTPHKVDVDNLDAPLNELTPAIIDALFLALFGISSTQYAEEMKRAAEEVQAQREAEQKEASDPLDPTIGTEPETI